MHGMWILIARVGANKHATLCMHSWGRGSFGRSGPEALFAMQTQVFYLEGILFSMAKKE